MKTSRSSVSAFTLVELLTVIAIIAILMGLLFPVIGTVKDKARGVEATNMLKQLVTSVTAYNTEYGKFPIEAAAGAGAATDTFLADDPAAVTFLKVLRAAPAADTDVLKLNPRLISYIDLPSSKNPVAAKAYSGVDSDGKLHDPWGGIYRFLIDTNYDNLISNPYKEDTGAGSKDLTKGIIVWCLGKDAKGAKEATAAQGDKRAGEFADDIISWQ